MAEALRSGDAAEEEGFPTPEVPKGEAPDPERMGGGGRCVCVKERSGAARPLGVSTSHMRADPSADAESSSLAE